MAVGPLIFNSTHWRPKVLVTNCSHRVHHSQAPAKIFPKESKVRWIQLQFLGSGTMVQDPANSAINSANRIQYPIPWLLVLDPVDPWTSNFYPGTFHVREPRNSRAADSRVFTPPFLRSSFFIVWSFQALLQQDRHHRRLPPIVLTPSPFWGSGTLSVCLTDKQRTS